uniref:Uncharacterized protein n=1 Tax=Sphaerodactylus townsendi TaxID=933632 RepID=A0ACB8FMS7_9SAUR
MLPPLGCLAGACKLEVIFDGTLETMNFLVQLSEFMQEWGWPSLLDHSQVHYVGMLLEERLLCGWKNLFELREEELEAFDDFMMGLWEWTYSRRRGHDPSYNESSRTVTDTERSQGTGVSVHVTLASKKTQLTISYVAPSMITFEATLKAAI